MLESGDGLVFRTRPLTESSLIVRWLTLEHGLISTVAKGARRNESPFRGKLDLGYRCRLSFVRSRRSDLHTLREAVVSETHDGIRHDYDRLAAYGYAVRLLEALLELETPVPSVFEITLSFLGVIGDAPDAAQLTLFYELKLLEDQGLWDPDFAATMSPGASAACGFALGHPLQELASLRLDAGQSAELHGRILRAWEAHLGFVPKAHPLSTAARELNRARMALPPIGPS